MTNNSKGLMARQRADYAIWEFLKEVCNPPFLIKESTFDETRDSTIECAKQNIRDSSLSDREKEYAKEAAEKAVREIAQMFKDGMMQSGKLV